MKQLVVTLLLLLSAASTVAKEQSHVDAAKQLLELMNSSQSIDQAYEQMYSHVSGMVGQMRGEEEHDPMFDRYLTKMVAVMQEEFSWERMEPYMVKAYVSVYTEQELLELSEFYATPIGQKFVAKMPELTIATMEVTQDLMAVLIPRLNEIQDELLAEVEKAHSHSEADHQ